METFFLRFPNGELKLNLRPFFAILEKQNEQSALMLQRCI